MRTSLKEHSPHLVDEWSEENYPLTPEKITYGSNKKVLWKGKCGHKWSAKNTPLSPDEISPKSRRNVWWTCKTCGYEWKAVVNARVKGSGCPVCSNRKVLVGYNDLSTTDKHILLDWDSLFIRGVFLFFCNILPEFVV